MPFVDFNLEEIGQDLASLDTYGHYSRSDVFELRVRWDAQNRVFWEEGE